MEQNGNGHKPTVKINLDYKRNATAEPNVSNSELTLNYIEAAVSSVHPQGLEGQMRRIFSRIQRKLDEAIEAKKDEIELEKAELDLLKKSFSECKVPAGFAKYFIVLEDEIERATKI